MFFVGFKKTAATNLKNYVKAIMNREIKIDQALTKATKGNKREMEKRLHSVQSLKKRVDKPLSMDMLEMAKKKGIAPDASARVAKSKLMGNLGEHAEHLQKTTREPLKQIRKETQTMARRKKHYAAKWDEVSKELTKKMKKKK